jgi:Tfp pilus assembly protein PilV
VLFYTLYGSNDNNSNYIILLLQISSQFGFIGVLSYIIRNVVQLFPYIFNKYYNYDRSQLYELLRGTLIATFLYLFSPHLQEKIVNLRNYFSNKLTNITKSKNFDKQAQTQNQAQQQTQQQTQQTQTQTEQQPHISQQTRTQTYRLLDDYLSRIMDLLNNNQSTQNENDLTISFSFMRELGDNEVPLYELVPRNEEIVTQEIYDNNTQIINYNSNNNTERICPISHEAFENEESITQIRHCGHIFKTENIKRWLFRNPCCPTCRYNIITQQYPETI